jgi:hypothetical protein
MIAAKRCKKRPTQASALESLPKPTKCRLHEALTLLADVRCYAPWFARDHEPGACALRISDLLRTGVNTLDCQWLLLTGYIEPVKPSGRARKQRLGRDAWLDEQMLVVLTHLGEAEARRAAAQTAANRKPSIHPFPEAMAENNGRLAHYDCLERQFFLRDALQFTLPSIASSIEAILLQFEGHGWKQRVACPFKNVAVAKRARMVRSAVHRLNKAQQPHRILFQTTEMGAWISYRVLDDS